MVEVTTIQIDTLTRERLKKYGIKDETYSSTLNKLMDNMDSINNKSNSTFGNTRRQTRS